MRKVLPNGAMVSFVVALALMCSGCSAAWIATLDSVLAAAAPALINILQIVAVAEGTTVNATLEAKINADAGAIKSLAADFAKASSGASAGVCQQLQAAVTVYASDQQLVLQAAQVSDPRTMAKITALVDLVAGTVSVITATIPACQGGVTPLDRSAPPVRADAFVNDYNRILLARTGNADVDAATPKLALHQHSKFARVVTFGKLN